MLSNGATFDYSSARFSLEAIDFNHSKTVVLLLHARGFYHYLCHDNLYLGMDLHTMTNVLRCVNNDDSTTTEVDHHGDIVAFTFQDSVLDKISHFVLWLMDVERKPI
ncbi:proliferating cell nuclear antigen [Vigna unguiculata]|uniref:Proliferating cell nuclear antigen n=1 Tax=Vigna unguiculata TaxID=3917 RepID=A0A4D6M8F2_VIGUN|nr:proliferating cell nuclear antigen [Vigna unguiculata]